MLNFQLSSKDLLIIKQYIEIIGRVVEDNNLKKVWITNSVI